MKLYVGRFRARWYACVSVLILLLSAIACSAQSPAPVIEVPNPPNAASQLAKPYVVLVSLDGFRYDYAQKYGAKHLLALAARGASTPDGMIPAFPSLTFPNHYTIVTGLYPDHHGIVANSFYDPVRNEKFSYSPPKKTDDDGTWYSGTPLWVLAEQQGMRSACFFWPGSEAEIQGKRPSYYLRYNDKYPDEARVDQILAWLRLPQEQRPHFLSLYYANVDHAGHAFGPDAPETGEAVRHVDEVMGKLIDGVAMSGLPVDLIVVSDHGMETSQGGWVPFDKWADLSQFETVGSLLYAKTETDAQKAFEALNGANDKFKVYRRANVPRNLHFDSNAREGDPVVIPIGPYSITAHVPANLMMPPRGTHGFDPATMPSMKAIFYAAGPDIRAGVALQPFENVDLYPFIAEILGLQIGAIDGQLQPLRMVLKKASSR